MNMLTDEETYIYNNTGYMPRSVAKVKVTESITKIGNKVCNNCPHFYRDSKLSHNDW